MDSLWMHSRDNLEVRERGLLGKSLKLHTTALADLQMQ